jgi:hypothetical protein
MFNNQRVGAKAKIHEFCKNSTRALEAVFDISRLVGHGNKRKYLTIVDNFAALGIHNGD